MPICPKCLARAGEVGTLCESDGYFFVDDDALLQSDGDPMMGRYLGDRFAVMKVLGDGGMGRVYEAIQHPVGRRAALKILKATLASNDRFLARFQREARAIAYLNHPNIVTLYDFGSDSDGTNYIAMEYVEGRPVTRYLRQHVEGSFVVHIARQVLAALQAAHDQRIVHRDLKPDNIMLTTLGGDDTFVKVLDFGLAHLVSEGEDLAITAAGEVFGTPLYMSPEQATSDEISPQTDLYSLGCIMFELFSGMPPFTGSRPMNVLMKHVNAPVPVLRPKPGVTISDALRAFITRCLQKASEDRHGSAAAALEALYQTPEGGMLGGTMGSFPGGFESMPKLERVPQGVHVGTSPTPTPPSPGDPAAPSQPAGAPPVADMPRPSAMPEASSWPKPVLYGAAAVAVALVALIVVWLMGGTEQETPEARADISVAVDVARSRTNIAFADGRNAIRSTILRDRFTTALADPAAARPGRKLTIRKPLGNDAWFAYVNEYHLKKVTATSYTDPIRLVFGP